ncbi:hypothetical protein [Clostridium sp. ZS2-4]|uniref:hypothetical protein n=1 Tax=Clostridium sp. ZS2-4 TaxID=2987703 RepID=UPI00227D6D18|nr:hypothetical protein [Clostridium sp. ZS2-4]MCY6355397.1 hypothetical protein [Clostridium sp. ZS2-4]
MGVGVNFAIANDFLEATRKFNLLFEEDIDNFIWNYRECFGDAVSILTEIDPYSDKIFSHNEIEKLLRAAKQLKKDTILNSLEKEFIKQNVNKNELIEFANALIIMCESALKQHKTMISIGY